MREQRAAFLWVGAAMWAAGLVACGGSDEGTDAATGGAATGGSATGGTATGGTATGGTATGGTATGGTATGGSVTGGSATGGSVTGGSATGGSATGGSATGGSATGGAPPAGPVSCASPAWDAADFAAVYEVGPGQEYATPSDVPWESIGPGTLVRIHRRATPYADKWVIAVAATADAPVVVLGVPEGGLLPEITGAGAVTRPELNYWSDTRGIIKIGGSSVPDLATATNIVVECLDIHGARGAFTDDAGAAATYDDNASAIFVESGAGITLRNNRFHDAGNGLFVAHESDAVVVSGNELFDNGNPGSIYEHNSYTEARGIVFEFNRYGELCAGCPGNNLKDRSSGLVVRYNLIEGGNRALDLVDSEYADINGAADYDDTFVYGNVLVELDDGGNRQLIHYGGDNDAAYFREGTLHFYHNTVVSERSGLFTVVRLSSDAATLDARNNVFYALGGGELLGVLEDAGTALLASNWLPTGWREGSPSLTGTVTATGSLEGDAPGFTDAASRDYTLLATSAARSLAGPLAPAAPPVDYQYSPPTGGVPRPTATSAGAFE